MVFQKKSKSNFSAGNDFIREPDVDYYLHLIMQTSIKAPTDALENNSNLSNAWTIVEMCAYQSEVFGGVKNLVDLNEQDSEYLKAIREEKDRIKSENKDETIINAKLAYFKLAYILKQYERGKPNIEEGDV